ncbi:ATP phosphoribosyltransferase [Francisellaceae bacterium]|nr:ATP phosphoribosyltransferase [Francisellaceae bacterium]
MKDNKRLRIAIQKKGRLNTESMKLLEGCGIKIRFSKSSLYCHAQNFPLDILFVRDDDIPNLVNSGVCDLGIVGDNELAEVALGFSQKNIANEMKVAKQLGFGRCRLSIAFPAARSYQGIQDLVGMKIATSYPNLLEDYFKKHDIDASALEISGSVEIAPGLGMSDAICDLVSSGRTLEENNLTEVEEVMSSQAVLIRSKSNFNAVQEEIFERLVRRIVGVRAANESKYVMFHAPKDALDKISFLLPGSEGQTIMPLCGNEEKVAVHTVTPEAVFWDTLENLRLAGATSILVLPIEKMLK